MTAARSKRFLVAPCLALVASTLLVCAQQAQQPFKPEVGRAGKDVVWVPTPQAVVDKMLDVAGLTPQDYVMDLGSGDGRTVITAAKRGARAVGVEYDPDMFALAQQSAAAAGVGERASFVNADLFETDLSQATVLTMFLLPQINLKLRPKILDLKPGTRIVSNTFNMEEWTPDESVAVTDGCDSSWCTVLLWIVPAKVGGSWKLADGELTLTQAFQMVTGTLKTAGGSAAVTDGRLRGEVITFTAGATQYTGEVHGNAMEGTAATPGKTRHWTATRTGA